MLILFELLNIRKFIRNFKSVYERDVGRLGVLSLTARTGLGGNERA